MEHQAEREHIEAIARSWISTPFHDDACVKGAGVDCAQLLRGVFIEAGLIPYFETERYSPQFYLHHAEERFLGWVSKFAFEISLEEAKPGDVVLFKLGLCFAHGAIVVKPGWPAIIHAHAATRCVRVGNGRNPHLGLRVLDLKFFSLWRD